MANSVHRISSFLTLLLRGVFRSTEVYTNRNHGPNGSYE